MSTITIQTGIPVPLRRYGVGRTPGGKYPIRNLAVGESFFVPFVSPERAFAAPALRAVISSLARRETKRNPEKKFASRSVHEDGVAGVRLWRLV